MSSDTKKIVLLVEDDEDVNVVMKGLIGRYEDSVELVSSQNAAQALTALTGKWPDFMVLDIMMSYQGKREVLGGGADLDDRETGLHLLEHLRAREVDEGRRSVWVAVTTARAEPGFRELVWQALGERGHLFNKPYDDLLLEAMLCHELGIPCLLDAEFVQELLKEAEEERAKRQVKS
ncbi:MAG: hypothetical protein ABIO70_05760 [Pseudomonadota bacterium]